MKRFETDHRPIPFLLGQWTCSTMLLRHFTLGAPTQRPRPDGVDTCRWRGCAKLSDSIACAVRAYHRFAKSAGDVEHPLTEPGPRCLPESYSVWIRWFFVHFMNCSNCDRPKPNNKWHSDEVVNQPQQRHHWRWRAVNASGGALAPEADHRERVQRSELTGLKTPIGPS